MKILADENIPQVMEAFSQFGNVELSHGRKISNDMLREKDVLIVRSITNVNKELLHGTKVKFVGTATIGTDHIDKQYLQTKQIFFADAAGCNSFSVAEYVLAAITNIYFNNGKTFKDRKIGIVGYGNIGTKIAKIARAIGLKTIINDPPLERKFGKEEFQKLEDALNCDIITFHVPLNKTGIDKTIYLLNDSNLKIIPKGSILINSSRGPVVQNGAILARLKEINDIKVVLDVWENEPNINLELLDLVDIGTAHIAGYSFEGKLNGTLYVYQKFCSHFNLPSLWKPLFPEIKNQIIDVEANNELEEIFFEVFQKIYNIREDSDLLKGINKNEEIDKYFDRLRKNYKTRREFNNYTIRLSTPNEKLKNIFKTLRFKVIYS
jgi:erythronate-4-phosphate dehydrogenase